MPVHYAEAVLKLLLGIFVDSATGAVIWTPMLAGTFEIAFTVSDGESGTDSKTATVTVQDVFSWRQDGGTLFVFGTSAADRLLFTPADGGGVQLKWNEVQQGVFTGVDRIVAYGFEGADNIQLAGSLTIPASPFGGEGDDRLKGGNGNDVILGGDGDDALLGGSGLDLLIGGLGEDRVVGDAHDDILIAGYTRWDNDLAALSEIMKVWTGIGDFGQRVTSIQGDGTANGFYLNAATVSDDAAYDVLTGSSGQDWFMFNSDSGVLDKATDLRSNEEA